jgi:hypothetical protein
VCATAEPNPQLRRVGQAKKIGGRNSGIGANVAGHCCGTITPIRKFDSMIDGTIALFNANKHEEQHTPAQQL